uniref:Saccharopine dehydrogenase NADP binding domain-containing protein n=1 Tax=Ditylum brightwellii TaxID=49249 RepID=A0A7S4SZI3_9STRA
MVTKLLGLWSIFLFVALVNQCHSLSLNPITKSASLASDTSQPYHFVILGGTGRIGTAVATHILRRSPASKITLAGRDVERGRNAVSEVVRCCSSNPQNDQITFKCVDWRDNDAFVPLIEKCDCVIHTAGPYLEEEPTPLRAAISAMSSCKAYVDVSDPLDFIDKSLAMSDDAVASGTSALVAAGAFPGMSNVLAMEAAKSLPPSSVNKVRDVRFNYFTAGLGGSGDVNLYITNLGFGEPMVQYDKGVLRFFKALSGLLLGKVDFFLQDNEESATNEGFGNDMAKSRIGRQTVFSWPFPEAATVAKELNISGDSSAAMGTAPDAWNAMLGLLVSIVPRSLWRSKRFSQFMADFSQPLVKATDALLKITSPDNVGETHAMRVDVTGEDGNAVSIVQAHESFRQCVGQSCAEFALDLLEFPSPGVQLPEQRYRDNEPRKRIIKRLTSTPGTIAFTGPTLVKTAPPPSDMEEAIQKANDAEVA